MIKKLLALSLDEKIEYSLNRIREFYNFREGKVYVSFSGGKDSTVLLHLVRSIYPDVPAVFCNTTNEFKEILLFVKTIDNLIELKPKLSFNQTVEKYGFPLVSKKVARQIKDLKNPTENNIISRNIYLTGITKDGKLCKSYKLSKKWMKLVEADFDITSKCCDVLKKAPFHKFEKESGLKGFIGTQTSESSQRHANWLKFGDNIYSGNNIKSRPISIWTEDDIWEYIRLNKVPYSSIYDDAIIDGKVVKGEVRTGCAYCGFGAHLNSDKFVRLKLRKPKQFEKMMNLKNNNVSFKEALDFVGVKI